MSDRGDDYFDRFGALLVGLVDEDLAGRSLSFVLVGSAGGVVGRVNLYDIDHPHRTELGFRVAESAGGRRVATRGVAEALRVAATGGVRSVTARASTTNIASQRVLESCGFTPAGPAATPAGSSRLFVGYQRMLRADEGTG